MKPFVRFSSLAIPFDQANVDTDRVIPARFLPKPRGAGHGQYAFYDVRHRADGSEDPDCVMNRPVYKDARILVADTNFGCGSSREQAVWVMMDETSKLWFRSIIAPSFGDIFYNNACKNGLLPIQLPAPIVAAMREELHRNPTAQVTIDLERQIVIGPSGTEHKFEIDPFRKDCLLQGLDDISLTLKSAAAIDQFEAQHRQRMPWLYQVPPL